MKFSEVESSLSIEEIKPELLKSLKFEQNSILFNLDYFYFSKYYHFILLTLEDKILKKKFYKVIVCADMINKDLNEILEKLKYYELSNMKSKITNYYELWKNEEDCVTFDSIERLVLG